LDHFRIADHPEVGWATQYKRVYQDRSGGGQIRQVHSLLAVKGEVTEKLTLRAIQPVVGKSLAGTGCPVIVSKTLVNTYAKVW
jgi:hypothetical protein